jgi:hypothetical protein
MPGELEIKFIRLLALSNKLLTLIKDLYQIIQIVVQETETLLSKIKINYCRIKNI